MKHNRAAYVNHKCRCEVCRAANSAWQREAIARRNKAIPEHVHGYGGYHNYGCRCETCTAANSDRTRQRRDRLAAA